MIIRRLGLSKLNQNKIKEGLIEIENYFEFSRLDSCDKNYQFNALIDLIKTYIFHDTSKVIFLTFQNKFFYFI